ncbi:MAG: hypothetical protein DI543_26870, partial [Bradyrhizobium icense]
MSIGKATSLRRRILNDPLAFQGTILLGILVWRIPEQHVCDGTETETEQKTEQREYRKEREKRRIPDQSSVENIKGVYPEFKYKLILTLSPIYNHDLQGLSHL